MHLCLVNWTLNPPPQNAQFLICSYPKREKKLKKEMADIYALAAAEFFSEDKDQVRVCTLFVMSKCSVVQVKYGFHFRFAWRTKRSLRRSRRPGRGSPQAVL